MDFLHQWIVPPEARLGDATYLAVSLLAMLISAVSKGGFGGGIGVISVPLLMQVLPTRYAIGMLLPVLVICDLSTIRNFPQQWEPRIFRHLTPGMIVGIAATTAMMIKLGGDAKGMKVLEGFLQISVAIISIVFVILQLRTPKDEAGEPWKPGWNAHIPISLIAGVTTTIAHAAGPVVNMYLLPQKLDRGVFVGTCGRLFAFINMLKIPFMVYAGVITLETFRYGVWMMLLAPLGVALGAWLNRRLSPVWFVRVVYLSLILTALKLVTDVIRSAAASA